MSDQGYAEEGSTLTKPASLRGGGINIVSMIFSVIFFLFISLIVWLVSLLLAILIFTGMRLVTDPAPPPPVVLINHPNRPAHPSGKGSGPDAMGKACSDPFPEGPNRELLSRRSLTLSPPILGVGGPLSPPILGAGGPSHPQDWGAGGPSHPQTWGQYVPALFSGRYVAQFSRLQGELVCG
jgi:hypothetical protein